MTTQGLLRGFFTLLFSGIVVWGMYLREERESGETEEYNTWQEKPKRDRPRYTSLIYSWLLPFTMAYACAAVLAVYGGEGLMPFLINFCLGLVIDISVYTLILMLLRPLLRRYVSPYACGVLWLLPNYLYLTNADFMERAEPEWVLYIPGQFMTWAGIVWLIGFAAVLLWKAVSHIVFRREILGRSYPVTDESILAQWEMAQCSAGMFKPKYRLVYSPDVRTPLTIGFFARTIRVVLPQRQYSPEELKLIFRHELVHIGRADSSSKFFMCFCTALCWFNPLIWKAMELSGEDLELSCDEAVLWDADGETRRKYAELILRTAGDERGFTTCLSATADGLRYRLGNIMKPTGRRLGGLAAGLAFAVMLAGSGRVALAYDKTTGGESIFQEKDTAEYVISGISRRDEDGFRFYECREEKLLYTYLEELELYRLTGNYAFPGEDYVSMILQGPEGTLGVTLRDHTVTVTPLYTQRREAYRYYSRALPDRQFLDDLLEPKSGE